MHRRVPSYDLELTVTAVAIQMQVGGNLSEVLDTISDTIRERVRTRRHIAALTAEGKLSGLIGFVLPWVMFVMLYGMNPEYMKGFFTEPMGLALLVGALVLQLLGGFWIWRLLAIEL
jgi:tight adherence protein B